MFGLKWTYVSLSVDCPVKRCHITVFSLAHFARYIHVGSLMRL